ncbi:ankyrin repeat-containing domain protein [Russula aff. rugulosa BPL654]|nr:ankyrin repeat-containing domain protein [Russula aff. rugulosa BPL654]
MVQVLLEFGVDVNAQNSNRDTPLDYASIQIHGTDGETPLHLASEYGRIEIVRLLIEHGANVEAKDDEGRTPLDVARTPDPWVRLDPASGKQREEVIKLLSTCLVTKMRLHCTV